MSVHGPASIDLRIVNRLSELESVRKSVEPFLERHSLGEKARHTADVVMEEALSNIMKYAFEDDALHHIDIHLTLDEQGLRLRFTDDGGRFDPLRADAPDLSAPLESRKVGGLGIELIRRLSDSVSYSRKNARNVLEVRIADPGAG